jgi:hypothetical protein
VTLTRITRGATHPALFWTLQVLISATATSPDPDAPARVLSDRASAEATAARLRAKGFSARVEAVQQPAVADVPAGVLGYRVRVGRFTKQVAADAAKAQLAAAGESANSVYTGWDGDPAARGPWHVNVVTIDPRKFRGTLEASFGPDPFRRETTSTLARQAGATVGVNGGYFVLDPASGAPGDPAGIGVYDGRFLSEPINDRPALVLRDDARRTAVRRFTWTGRVRLHGAELRLDGLDRVPNLIRNCGGDSTDQPTARPLGRCTTPPVPTTASWSPSPPNSARPHPRDLAARSSSTRIESSEPHARCAAPVSRRGGCPCRQPAHSPTSSRRHARVIGSG